VIAIAPTDGGWFEFLRRRPDLQVVNFWTPTPWNVRGLSEGERFYFLRKGQEPRYIGGWGSFSDYQNLRAREAWRRYGQANGCETYEEMLERLSDIAGRRSELFQGGDNPEIGCILLTEPVFLDESRQRLPSDFGLEFPPQVVKLKYFDRGPLPIAAESPSRRPPAAPSADPSTLLNELGELDATRQSTARTEQHIVRSLLLGNRDRGRCALCGEEYPVEFLVAAHVKRRSDCTDEERRNVSNVILACKFGCDELFERGYIVVSRGKVVAKTERRATPVVANRMTWLHGKSCGAWCEQNAAFFVWHAENFGH
jgi:putative restriction endonuclease